VADIFQEVDEEVRREQLKKLWERYQNHAVAAAILILAGVGSWWAYDYWQTKRAAEAGTAFENAITLSEQGKHAEAADAFAKIGASSTATYQALAQVRAAAELAQTDPKGAILAYDKIAADSSITGALRDVAGLRAGALMIDNGSFADVRARLEPLTGTDHTFHHTARELLALAAWRVGDTAAARKWIDAITADPETPADERSRVQMLDALMASADKS
jgi:hypothetical protein